MINEECATMEKVKPHPMSDRITLQYLEILAGPRGNGGASHKYAVVTKPGPDAQAFSPVELLFLQFQEGPLGENNLNGVGIGTILQICLRFLAQCQGGPFPSRETAVAITKIEEALQWLKQRENDREQRGVLGYNKI